MKAHAGTERRGKRIPYIVHPLEAMAIVATVTTGILAYTDDPEVLRAARNALGEALEAAGAGQ